MSLEAEMQNWLTADKRNEVSATTFDNLERCAKLHIYPYLGYLPINEVDTDTMQRYATDMSNNISPHILHKCKGLLNGFFNYCKDRRLLSQNPMDNVSYEKQAKSFEETINPEHRELFVKTVSTSRFWKPFCFTILFTGIRISEILALKWEDIDFDGKYINVKNIVTADFQSKDDGRGVKRNYVIQPVLTENKIPFSDTVNNALLEYKKFREREQRHNDNGVSFVKDGDLVFGDENGELRSYSGISHNLRKYLNKKGLGKLDITFSKMRSTYKEMLNETIERVKNMEIQRYIHSTYDKSILENAYYSDNTGKLKDFEM